MIPDTLKRLLQAAAVGGGALTIAGVLVGHFEGRKHIPYKDPVGVWTVCEGHTGPGVVPGRTYTDSECDQFKAADLALADAAVRRLVKVPLTEWQRGALIDFVFNMGVGNFASSTLLRKLNAGDYAGACAEYQRWVYAGGRKLAGLENRREAETWTCSQS